MADQTTPAPKPPLAARAGSALSRPEVWNLLVKFAHCFVFAGLAVRFTWESRGAACAGGQLVGLGVTLILWKWLIGPPNAPTSATPGEGGQHGS